jgi:hypothetical protein
LRTSRAYLAPYYSHTGRPSINPELRIRMLIIGYCFGFKGPFSALRRNISDRRV